MFKNFFGESAFGRKIPSLAKASAESGANFRFSCFVILLSLIFVSSVLRAQFVCGTQITSEDQSLIQQQANSIANWTGNPNRDGENYFLPVVVHILHDNGIGDIPDQQVIDALQFTNFWYANENQYLFDREYDYWGFPEITFKLAKRDPLGNCTTGIIHHDYAFPDGFPSYLLADCPQSWISTSDLYEICGEWPTNKYINVYVVPEICATASGFASEPYIDSQPTENFPEMGIVILFDKIGYNFSSSPESALILAHELGHHLGLKHPDQSRCNVGEDGPLLQITLLKLTAQPKATNAVTPTDISAYSRQLLSAVIFFPPVLTPNAMLFWN